jgi:kynurenine formamidase
MSTEPFESTNADGVRFVDLSVPIQEPVDGELVGSLAANLAATVEYRDHDVMMPRALDAFGCEPEDLPDGKAWASEKLTLTTHAGTHIDAPWHYFPTCEGRPSKTIDEVPLSACFGDGVVLDLTAFGPGERVGREAVQAAVEATGQPLTAGEIVLLRFDGDRAFGTGEYWTRYPGLSAEATIWLCDQGIKTMGTDAVGFDRDFDSSKRDFAENHDASWLWEAHRVGIDREYFHMEKLANLRLLPPRGFKVSCFPVRIRAASAAWIRAVAIIGL